MGFAHQFQQAGASANFNPSKNGQKASCVWSNCTTVFASEHTSCNQGPFLIVFVRFSLLMALEFLAHNHAVYILQNTLSRTQYNKFQTICVCPTFLAPVHLNWDVLGLVLFTARYPPVANCRGQGHPDSNFDWKTMNSLNSNWTRRQAVWSQDASHSQGGNLNLLDHVKSEIVGLKSSQVSQKDFEKARKLQ